MILQSFHSTDKLEVFIRPDGERGVRALQQFKSGSFVCEFEANLLSKAECEEAEKEYVEEGKPVYILEVYIPKLTLHRQHTANKQNSVLRVVCTGFN